MSQYGFWEVCGVVPKLVQTDEFGVSTDRFGSVRDGGYFLCSAGRNCKISLDVTIWVFGSLRSYPKVGPEG